MDTSTGNNIDLQVQWYPGHMTRTKRMLSTQMGLIDVVVEVLDARIPLSSRNPDIDNLAKGKKRVLVLNKADLASQTYTAQWEDYFHNLGFFTLQLNAKQNDRRKSGIHQFNEMLKAIMKERADAQRKRGRINVPTRAMIVGIPNVGKSTFINLLAGRASTTTADRPGVTRGRQWIKIDTSIDVMDTPGVLWPKFEDRDVGLKLACTGAVSDNVVDKIALAEHFIALITAIDKRALEARYKIECGAVDSALDMRRVLENIAEARGFKMKGGVVDIERAAIILLDEFRSGKLGRITLELPK